MTVCRVEEVSAEVELGPGYTYMYYHFVPQDGAMS